LGASATIDVFFMMLSVLDVVLLAVPNSLNGVSSPPQGYAASPLSLED
jgi:hypothetical protein